MANIVEQLHKIKEDLRKKNGDEFLDSHADTLLKLETEIRRNAEKCFKDKKRALHFTAGDLRIICTTIRTKLNRYQKKLYYEGVSKKFDALDKIMDDDFIRIMTEAINDYRIAQKLLNLHYLYGTITATVELVELTRK